MYAQASVNGSCPPSTDYAVKVLVMAEHHTAAYKQQLRELSLHDFACRHPNIVTIHKTIQRGDLILIIMDLCHGGDLFTMITEKQRVSLRLPCAISAKMEIDSDH
jgi:serine/threonine protein kinase